MYLLIHPPKITDALQRDSYLNAILVLVFLIFLLLYMNIMNIGIYHFQSFFLKSLGFSLTNCSEVKF